VSKEGKIEGSPKGADWEFGGGITVLAVQKVVII
jgi:hypothetical protein